MRAPISVAGGTLRRVDVLRWPVVGPLLRWRHARTTLQLLLLGAAVIVVLHGLFGPEIASANLGTVLTWVHYRGLLVVALLAAGNMFCAGCPFVRVRDWGRRLHRPVRRWPTYLRGKWIAIVLFAGVLFTYEWFDLWALPRATAFLVLAYFASALVIDLIFTGATFCKHLCPVGQFNFLASTVSPLELRIREPATCQGCATSDCIVGRRAPEAPHDIVQRGCELGLYLPAKIGNLDCTFCLDCVQACPHDNIALASRTPGRELADGGRRSGIGRITARPDLACLVLLFVFGAMLNAFAMAAPVRDVERTLAQVLGTASELPVLAVLFVFALVILPAVLVGGAAIGTRLLTPGPAQSVSRISMRFVYGLVPLGFGVWLAHYGFHLLTGVFVVVPIVQSAAIDLTGESALGEPLWTWAGMRPGAVFPLQLGVLALGTIGSLGVTSLIAEQHDGAAAGRALMPWAFVILLLAAAAVWVLYQPMEMRGLGVGA